MAPSHRLLVVDDDVRLARLVRDYFTREGFEVDVLHHGSEAVTTVLRTPPDLILLDRMLPGEDGLTICKHLRAKGVTIPILMLTARGDENDQVVGLEVGADDYVAKPASPRLLLARVRALLRRKGESPPSGDTTRSVGPLHADATTRQIRLEGVLIPLTTAEFDLLWVLVGKAGQPVSREMLVRELRGIAYDGVDRSIDVRVSQLRRKLKRSAAVKIRTIRSVGYQLVCFGDDG